MGLLQPGAMAAGTLYTYPENFRAYKALIAAEYSGAKVTIASNFKFGETNKTDAFLKKFPLGKVPAFEGTDGTWLFESNAIAHYVANDQLLATASRAAQAQVQQCVNFGDQELLPASCTWVFPTLGIMQYNKNSTERSKDDVKAALKVLNQHLETRTYLVGERITLADICVACNLFLLYQHVMEPAFREAFVNVNRWFITLVNQPQFKKVVGDFKLCEKMAQFDAEKFRELQGGAAKGGKDKKQKAPKPKQEPKPKEAAPEPEEEPKPKPSKDPFAALPAGTLVMDEWKKMYQNNDTLTVALPWFWEKFEANKEHYSIWKCEYKYTDELKLMFMSANLVSGMMQRLDRMRKHAFGSMILFGESNKTTISGIWVWKGQDLAFTLSEDLQIDYESYDWTKLNPDDAKTKTLVKEYFDGKGDFDGKKYNQAKTFL